MAPANTNGKTLRVGVIGAGFISQVAHLHALSRQNCCVVQAISDNRQALCRQVAENFSIATCHSAYESILEDPDIDAVVIAMPRRATGPIVEQALMAKKAVLSEKPMAYTLEQGRRLVSAAEKQNIPYAIGYMRRHDPGVRLFRRLLTEYRESGELGRIIHVAVRDFCQSYTVAIPDHVRSEEQRPFRYREWPAMLESLPNEFQHDYEYTLNVASHDINLLRFLFGNEIKAGAFSVRAKTSQSAIMHLGDVDIVLQVGHAAIGHWDQSIDVYFEKGMLRLQLPSPLARGETASITLLRNDQQESIEVPVEQGVWAFTAQAEHFITSVANGKPVEASGQDSLQDLAIIEQLWNKVSWRN